MPNRYFLNPGLVLSDWIRDLARRRSTEGIILNFGFRRFLLVTGRDLSRHILNQSPSTNTYAAGPGKVAAVSFLAEQSLTLSHDEKWDKLRPLNEQTLSTGGSPDLQQAALFQVQVAFAQPVSSIDDIRDRMGRVMLGVVFGGAPPQLAQDIQVLFGYVQSLPRRKLLGWTQRGRRERFYGSIRQSWNEAQGTSLLARAHTFSRGGHFDEDQLLQQIPHWMFTFTGSGTDLLSRTLAMLGSRPEVAEQVRQEINAAGPLDQAISISRLNFVEACLLETCRLFPPVTRTSHVAPQGDTFDGVSIPAGLEILHYFLISLRDTSVDPSANYFEPDKWLDPGNDRRSVYPNIFLSGARACPGESLILFVCKAAIIFLYGVKNEMLSIRALTTDPLSFPFPKGTPRFRLS
jgi:cytochrome P450